MTGSAKTELSTRRFLCLLVAGGICASGAPSDAAATPVTPDVGKIIYHKNNDIYAVNSQGTENSRLTQGPAIDQTPAWSPDHRFVAFARQRGTGPSHIYIMRADGSGVRQVTSGSESDFFPTWSPNSAWLAFTRGFPNGHVYKVSATGRHITRVVVGQDPSWSPNGRQIAFVRPLTTGRLAIYVAHPDGTHVKRITPRAVGFEAPDWSLDGKWLAAVELTRAGGNPAASTSDIVLLKSDGSDVKEVTTDHLGVDSTPAWAPTGDTIVFCRTLYGDDGHVLRESLETVSVPAAGSSLGLSQLPPTRPVGVVTGDEPDW